MGYALKHRPQALAFLLLTFLFCPLIYGQASPSNQLRSLAFYNLENLFDTMNDTLTFDDARTPRGEDRWTRERYIRKIENISRVLATMVKTISDAYPDIVGLCEVENRTVIEDLVNSPLLIAADYGIIHSDSPDERGIDVALIYRRAAFTPLSVNNRRLLLYEEDEDRKFTRDVLVIGGLLDGEEIYLLVNHWPSRSGGQARSENYRLAAATLNKKILDSIENLNGEAKVIIMGDLNDNPSDKSLKKVLKAVGDTAQLGVGKLFNPMEALFKKGIGSLAYRDSWSLFDQILLSANMLNPANNGYCFWKSGVYSPSYLVTPRGRYRGYPLRTYTGGRYTGGFSDHFPVYIILARRMH